MRSVSISCALSCLAGVLCGQVPPAIPYARTLDLLVVDTTFDGVWRLSDYNQDGDHNDPGETAVYYDENVGSVQLSSVTCIATGSDGTVYVGDSSVDVILAMRDANGDGDAHDAGEHRVFFDNSNLSGVVMASVGGITVDALGRVFLAVANSGSTGTDLIIALEDLDGDGDANDAGEAVDYHTVPGSVALGDSIPTEVLAGLDANLYYAEVGATGAIPKGVYRLEDGNFDGDCNDPGERTLFWDTTALGSASPFHYGMAIDADFRFYLTDHSTNEQVWTARDLDGSETIDSSETTLFYQTAASTWWDVVVRDDGTVLLCEDQTPDRITALKDLNNDGDALDPGEAIEVYDETVSPNPDVRPRGAALLRAPLLTLSPPSVQIGNTTSLICNTEKPGDLAAVFLSVGLATPFALPPFGQVELDTSQVVGLGFGVADASGFYSLPLAIPGSPSAVGTYGAQSWAGGGFRFFLSNGALLTVTP